MSVSTVAERAARRLTPPFDIIRAAVGELVVSDLEASEHFYVELLGLQVSERTSDALYLRGWEELQHHSLVLRRGPQVAAQRLVFRVRADQDLHVIEREFGERGCEVEWVSDGEHPGRGRALRVWDPFAAPLEFVCEMGRLGRTTQRFDLQRGAPILRFDHFNLHTVDPEASVAYWQELGFRCSEYISTDGAHERMTGAWMYRKQAVHDVALTLGRGPRLHHFGLWVGEPMGVIRACDQLAAAGHAASIERGPGRHGVSNAFFVYLRDPDGHRIELYACDYFTGDPDFQPLRWSAADPSCRSFWGTRAPDSWYEESSLLLDRGGEPVPTVEATADERDSHDEAFA